MWNKKPDTMLLQQTVEMQSQIYVWKLNCIKLNETSWEKSCFARTLSTSNVDKCFVCTENSVHGTSM